MANASSASSATRGPPLDRGRVERGSRPCSRRSHSTTSPRCIPFPMRYGIAQKLKLCCGHHHDDDTLWKIQSMPSHASDADMVAWRQSYAWPVSPELAGTAMDRRAMVVPPRLDPIERRLRLVDEHDRVPERALGLAREPGDERRERQDVVAMQRRDPRAGTARPSRPCPWWRGRRDRPIRCRGRHRRTRSRASARRCRPP